VAVEIEDAGTTATIKFGRDYDAPWLKLAGNPRVIRDQIIEAFGYDGASVAELSTAELIAQAGLDASALWTVTRDLGARHVSQPAKGDEPPFVPTNGPKGAAAFAAVAGAASEPEPQGDPLIAALEAVTEAKELAVIWKDNKERFDEPEVRAAAAEAQKRVAA